MSLAEFALALRRLETTFTSFLGVPSSMAIYP